VNEGKEIKKKEKFGDKEDGKIEEREKSGEKR
jgi:hypothetical protein